MSQSTVEAIIMETRPASTALPLPVESIDKTGTPPGRPAISSLKSNFQETKTLTSKRSGSNLTSQKPNSLRRSRALKRGGIDLVPLSEEHFPYAWAAYRRGSFNGSPLFPADMNVVEFTAKLDDFRVEMICMGHEVGIWLARKGEETIPVGLVSIEYSDIMAIPHFVWFPEASSRNHLELALKFHMNLKKQHLVLINLVSRKGEKSVDVKFNEHLCKYGVLRRVGTIRDYYGTDVNGVLFQSVGN